MDVINIIAYKVVPQKYIIDKNLFQIGKEFPKINRIAIGTVEQAKHFEKIRLEKYGCLPSRNNLFVFYDKQYASKWAAKLQGKLDDFLIVELSLTGQLTWFDCNYWDLNDPENYWKSASDEPSSDPMCEGIFCGEAIITDIKLLKCI